MVVGDDEQHSEVSERALVLTNPGIVYCSRREMAVDCSVNDINRLGSWLGLMGQSKGDQGPELAPSPGDRVTAERHGRRVARIAKRWKEGGDYEVEYVRERSRRDAQG